MKKKRLLLTSWKFVVISSQLRMHMLYLIEIRLKISLFK